MNRLPMRWVQAVMYAGALLVMAGGCVEINGGAVELSWSIRTNTGDKVTRCDLASDGEASPDLDAVRICWEAVGPGDKLSLSCADEKRYAQFDCVDLHGITGFDIDTGPTGIWLEPRCQGSLGAPPANKYEVPAPIVRDIENGGVATLNALLIVVSPDACATSSAASNDCPGHHCALRPGAPLLEPEPGKALAEDLAHD